MENFTCAKPVRGSGATREPTGQIWIYDYAVPVCKKGRPNCGGPSEEGKRPAGDDGRSHSKASKPLRCCDTRHCGRHGTSSSRTFGKMTLKEFGAMRVRVTINALGKDCLRLH